MPVTTKATSIWCHHWWLYYTHQSSTSEYATWTMIYPSLLGFNCRWRAHHHWWTLAQYRQPQVLYSRHRLRPLPLCAPAVHGAVVVRWWSHHLQCRFSYPTIACISHDNQTSAKWYGSNLWNINWYETCVKGTWCFMQNNLLVVSCDPAS